MGSKLPLPLSWIVRHGNGAWRLYSITSQEIFIWSVLLLPKHGFAHPKHRNLCIHTHAHTVFWKKLKVPMFWSMEIKLISLYFILMGHNDHYCAHGGHELNNCSVSCCWNLLIIFSGPEVCCTTGMKSITLLIILLINSSGSVQLKNSKKKHGNVDVMETLFNSHKGNTAETQY